MKGDGQIGRLRELLAEGGEDAGRAAMDCLLDASSPFILPELVAALHRAGMIDDRAAVQAYIASQIVAFRRRGRPYFAEGKTIAKELGIPYRRFRNIIRSSETVRRHGVRGGRRREWLAGDMPLHLPENPASGPESEHHDARKSAMRRPEYEHHEGRKASIPQEGIDLKEDEREVKVGKRPPPDQPSSAEDGEEPRDADGRGGEATGAPAALRDVDVTTPEGLAEYYHAALGRAGHRLWYRPLKDHRYAERCLESIPDEWDGDVISRWIDWYVSGLGRCCERADLYFTRFSGSWEDFEPLADGILDEKAEEDEKERRKAEVERCRLANLAREEQRRRDDEAWTSFLASLPTEEEIRTSLEAVALPRSLHPGIYGGYLEALHLAVPNVGVAMRYSSDQYNLIARMLVTLIGDPDAVFARSREFVASAVVTALARMRAESHCGGPPRRADVAITWHQFAKFFGVSEEMGPSPEIRDEDAKYRDSAAWRSKHPG